MFRAVLFFLGCFFVYGSHGGTSVNQAVLLQYHHVSSDTPSITSVTPEQFEAHLDLITSLNLQVLSLDTIISQIKSGKGFAKDTVAITFDDGYLSIYEHAYPLLKERRLPFSVFVNPKAIDDAHSSQMTWQQLREMQQNGATIANHSTFHNHLLEKQLNESEKSWLSRTKKDIEWAQKRLVTQLGIKNKWLAYPYGEFDQKLKSLLIELGFLGFSQQSGPINKTTDWQAIPRFPASGVYANPKTLSTKLTSLAFEILIEKPASKVHSVLEQAPTLELVVERADINNKQVQCYFSGQAIYTEAETKKNLLLITAQASSKLPMGRSRYNCTAPSLTSPRYYWYSMPFVTTNQNNEWLN